MIRSAVLHALVDAECSLPDRDAAPLAEARQRIAELIAADLELNNAEAAYRRSRTLTNLRRRNAAAARRAGALIECTVPADTTERRTA